jgi:hypothetical protein
MDDEILGDFFGRKSGQWGCLKGEIKARRKPRGAHKDGGYFKYFILGGRA